MCMEVDLSSHTAKRLPLKISTLTNVMVDNHSGDMVVVGSHFNPLGVFRDFSKVKEIRIMSRYRTCKNGEQISERWSQQRGDDIFNIDDNNRLYRLRWSDISNGKYLVELFANQAEDFYAARNNKMSVLYMNGLLMIDDGKKIELKTVNKKAKWTIVIRSLSRWIVSGDVDGYAVLASINNKAELESTIEIKLTALANGGLYLERQILIPTMYAIKVVFHRRNRSVLLAVERDGCFHLVAQASKRPLLLLKSYGRVSSRCEDHPYDRIICTATKTMLEGEFIISGTDYLKRIVFKLN